jgi:hypothetical protein
MRRDMQVTQYVAEVEGPNCRFRVFRTGERGVYLFCALDQYGLDYGLHIPIPSARLVPELRSALAHGYGRNTPGPITISGNRDKRRTIVGLDWCLRDKPRPGFEREFEEFEGLNLPPEQWRRYTISPYESAGVPRIGIDEAATRYFVDVIVPSFVEAGGEVGAYWSRPIDELIAENWGRFVPAISEVKELSTYQTAEVFQPLAGVLSFRGKVVGHSPILSEELQDRAYVDMTPPEMVEYAAEIERAALDYLRDRVGVDFTPALALETAGAVVANARERALSEGFTEIMPGFLVRNKEDFELEPDEEAFENAHALLTAARWLRFWADLGHGIYAWF